MEKVMTIFYEVHDNLYVNLTNRCPCSCTFCLRQTRDHMEQSDVLWLDHAPTFAEVVEAAEQVDVSGYREVVFCGFGEPTEALDVLKKTAAYIKENWHKPIRLNTNGLGNRINGRDILPELAGLIDTVSISLNTPDKEAYHRLVRCEFGEEAFDEMIAFAKESTKYIPHVVMTTVATTITKEQEEECRNLCTAIGADYRIREKE